jgi:hypothetical protein
MHAMGEGSLADGRAWCTCYLKEVAGSTFECTYVAIAANNEHALDRALHEEDK